MQQQKSSHRGALWVFLIGFVVIVAIPHVMGTDLTRSLSSLFAGISRMQQVPVSSSSYAVQGQPTISADFINQVLHYYGSPAQGQGQAFYDLGQQWGIDPVFALAWFNHESSMGLMGMARVTLSIGNERPSSSLMRCSADGCYQAYGSWSEGIGHWYWQITQYLNGAINKVLPYGHKTCPCVTVSQIIPHYAPPQDGNNDAAYICAIKNAVASWRSGYIAIRKLVCS